MIRFMDMDLSSAKTAYDNCMEVKNKSVYNIHEYIVKNNMKYVSYGVSKDLRNRNNDDAEKNVFWIDVPGYSQFSVHFHPRVIENDLEKLEPMPDYEMVLDADGRREQVALLSKKSPAFRIFEKKEEEFEKLNATVQWTVAATSSKTGGYYSETNSSHSAK